MCEGEKRKQYKKAGKDEKRPFRDAKADINKDKERLSGDSRLKG